MTRDINKRNESTQVMKVQGRCRKDIGWLVCEYWGFLIPNVIRVEIEHNEEEPGEHWVKMHGIHRPHAENKHGRTGTRDNC